MPERQEKTWTADSAEGADFGAGSRKGIREMAAVCRGEGARGLRRDAAATFGVVHGAGGVIRLSSCSIVHAENYGGRGWTKTVQPKNSSPALVKFSL